MTQVLMVWQLILTKMAGLIWLWLITQYMEITPHSQIFYNDATGFNNPRVEKIPTVGPHWSK